MLFRKKGCRRVSLSCVYDFNKSLKEFDKINWAFFTIWDDFDGSANFKKDSCCASESLAFYVWTFPDLTSPPSSGLVCFNDSQVIRRKIHSKIWGYWGNNLYIPAFEMLKYVLMRIRQEGRKAVILTFTLWNGHCFLVIIVVSEPICLAVTVTLRLKGVLTFIFFLFALTLYLSSLQTKYIEGIKTNIFVYRKHLLNFVFNIYFLLTS